MLNGTVVPSLVNWTVDRDHNFFLEHTARRYVVVITGIVPSKEQRGGEILKMVR
jgi:hypothetical protein